MLDGIRRGYRKDSTDDVVDFTALTKREDLWEDLQSPVCVVAAISESEMQDMSEKCKRYFT